MIKEANEMDVFVVMKDKKTIFGVFSTEEVAKKVAEKMNKEIENHKYTVEKHEVWEAI